VDEMRSMAKKFLGVEMKKRNMPREPYYWRNEERMIRMFK
jgi:hypothetical protein